MTTETTTTTETINHDWIDRAILSVSSRLPASEYADLWIDPDNTLRSIKGQAFCYLRHLAKRGVAFLCALPFILLFAAAGRINTPATERFGARLTEFFARRDIRKAEQRLQRELASMDKQEKRLRAARLSLELAQKTGARWLASPERARVLNP